MASPTVRSCIENAKEEAEAARKRAHSTQEVKRFNNIIQFLDEALALMPVEEDVHHY